MSSNITSHFVETNFEIVDLLTKVGLAAGKYDFVVHSLKDMPTTLPTGLILTTITAREDARDALVVSLKHKGAIASLSELPEGAVVGTSSLRRKAMLLRHFPGLKIISIRGNLQTRLVRAASKLLCLFFPIDGTHPTCHQIIRLRSICEHAFWFTFFTM